MTVSSRRLPDVRTRRLVAPGTMRLRGRYDAIGRRHLAPYLLILLPDRMSHVMGDETVMLSLTFIASETSKRRQSHLTGKRNKVRIG
jgi:hypothetical protein